MPGEWEPHQATWLVRPHNARDWPGKLAAIRWVYVEIIRHLHTHETVCLVVQDAKGRDAAKRFLSRGGVDVERLQFVIKRTDRSWVRDSGPTFVTDSGKLRAVSWKFNAWAKYSNWKLDATLSGVVANHSGAELVRPEAQGSPVVMEGGAIDSNGQGTVMTTEECLLSTDRQVRNPKFNRAALEQVFAEYLGTRKILWLGRGIVGDDTHGHVDDIARFVGARRVVAASESDSSDENYAPLNENLKRLHRATDQDGRSIEVITLPMPRPLYFDGVRLPASYLNFYIANGLVLVPTFNDPNDRIALSILAECFPDREVCGIHCVDMVWGLGTLHCATQQQPACSQAST